MLLKIAGIAIISVCIILFFKEVKPSFGVFVSIAASILILFIVYDAVQNIITQFVLKITELSVPIDVFNFLLKVIGVSFVIEFIVSLTEDAGCNMLASKIKIAGKILLAVITIPMLFDLLDLIMSFI